MPACAARRGGDSPRALLLRRLLSAAATSSMAKPSPRVGPRRDGLGHPSPLLRVPLEVEGEALPAWGAPEGQLGPLLWARGDSGSAGLGGGEGGVGVTDGVTGGVTGGVTDGSGGSPAPKEEAEAEWAREVTALVKAGRCSCPSSPHIPSNPRPRPRSCLRPPYAVPCFALLCPASQLLSPLPPPLRPPCLVSRSLSLSLSLSRSPEEALLLADRMLEASRRSGDPDPKRAGPGPVAALAMMDALALSRQPGPQERVRPAD